MNFSRIVCSIALITSLGAVSVYSMYIFQSAEQGNVARVQELFAAGAVVNQQGQLGYTPLHLAAMYGRQTVVKTLLSAGAAVNQQDLGGRTPLHNAAKNGHETVVQALLAAGADQRIVDSQGHSPLDLAVSFDSAILCRCDSVANILFDALEANRRMREVAATLAGSTHERLGAQSPMSLLPQDLLGEIARLSSQN